MSQELTDYLNKMNSDYDEVIATIKSQKEEEPTLRNITLLFRNNEKIQDYIINIYKGANLSNEEDNEKALRKTYERHVDFMNFVYSL